MLDLKIFSGASASQHFRKELLAGVSAISVACVMLAPHSAVAQTACPTVSTSVTGPVSLNGDCTVTSAGTISGGYGGITNNGTVTNTLTNSGSISGGYGDGIYNSGTIGALDNQVGGVISSNYYFGINNFLTGIIGTLTNAGTITSIGYYGISNDKTIDLLDNQASGVISSNYYLGIYNGFRGTIGTLTNAGTISGGNVGIYNSGTIGALTNAGTISGGNTGIYNGGTIGSLVNSGTITGAKYAINSNSGYLGDIANSGLISGNINVSGQNLTIAGSSGTTFGTLTGGTITLTPGETLAIGPGNQILTDNVDVGSAGNVTNSGTLQIGAANTPAIVSVNGNYTQTSLGTLQVIVTPTRSSQLDVSGTANLAGGLNYVFAPGTYTPKNYVFISANGGFNGTNFTTYSYDGVPLTDVSTTYTPDPTGSLNILAGFSFPYIVNPDDAAIFSAQTQALAQSTQQTNASLLGIAGTGGAASSSACSSQPMMNPNSTSTNGVADSGRIAQAIASEFCGAGGWIQATGSLGHVGSGDGASAYNADSAGFLAGIDKLVGTGGTRLGFAVGYDETNLNDRSGGKANMGTTRVAVYSSVPVGAFTLAAELGYGYAASNTTRADGIGDIKANNNRSIINAGVQASTNVNLGRVTITPEFGVRFASLQATHFAESASGLGGAFALSGESQNYNSVQPYAQATAHENFVTASGFVVSPSVTVGMQDEAARRGGATSVFAADGTPFQTSHNALDPITALLGAGLSASKNNLTLFVGYTGQIAGNWNTQTGEAGLRVNF